MKFLIMLLLFAVGPSFSFGNTCDSQTIQKIDRLLDSGKQVIIIAWTDKDKCGDEDEACGDWADRLNQFKTKQSKTLEIIKLAPNKWKQVVTLSASDIPRQSALFQFKGHPSYFHKGPILEFDVYQAVLDSWKGITPQSKDFLPEKIDVNSCK